MRAFLQVVWLELLAAVRSRALAALVVATVAWTLVLPRLARGGAGDDGLFALHVRYSLGVAFAAVLVAISAAAAGSLAKDRDAKRLQLSMVRPVRHMAIALGRMVALTLCGSLALALSCAAFALREGGGRTCSHVFRPVLERPEAAAKRLYAEYMEKYPDFRKKVAETGEAEVMRYLVQYVKDTYQTVGPGESASWDFAGVPDDGSALSLRIRVTDMFGRMDKVSGTFRMRGLEGRLDHVNKTLLRIPILAAEGADAPPRQAAPGPLERLDFSNEGSLGVSLHPSRDLALLSEADGFWWNILRAWLVMSSVLSIAVAAGVFFGACLGRSVAVFSIMAMLVASVVSPSVLDDYPDPLAASKADRMSLHVTDFAEKVTSPMNAYSPVSSLEDGDCVEWADVVRSAAAGFLVYPLFFAFLSGFVMRRKLD